MIGGKSTERVASSGSEVVGHRRFITGSLAAGAALTTGAAAWKAWPQNARPLPTPTVPIECVPTVPFETTVTGWRRCVIYFSSVGTVSLNYT
jgi:hypothetical protein